MKKLTKIIIILIFLTLIVGFYRVLNDTVPQEKNLPQESQKNKEQTIKTVLEINDKRFEGVITELTSVYDFMSKLRDEGKISFKDKTYPGMGILIEEINGLRSSGNKYWIYSVNGKEAQVGVLDYKINPGDIVSWKYKNGF